MASISWLVFSHLASVSCSSIAASLRPSIMLDSSSSSLAGVNVLAMLDDYASHWSFSSSCTIASATGALVTEHAFITTSTAAIQSAIRSGVETVSSSSTPAAMLALRIKLPADETPLSLMSSSGTALGHTSFSSSLISEKSTLSGTDLQQVAQFATSASLSSEAQPSAVQPSNHTPGKRGIGYGDPTLLSPFGNSISWAYNWGLQTTALTLEYVPMLWNASRVADFASNIGAATHVLGFNEPDHAQQANIDPYTAVEQHTEAMRSLAGRVQIGSPAVTNGIVQDPPMGLNWLRPFLSACQQQDCPVDFLAFHWYGLATNFDDFRNHVQQIVDLADEYSIATIWLTEFGSEGDTAAQAAFMAQAVPFLNQHDRIERYAGFMASEGTLLADGALNAIGKAYTS